MEKFKAVEKEMKTKQYSKEGLSAATKLDPKEKEKMDVADFLGDMVEQLGQQIEGFEAEMDTLQVGLKKKKSDNSKADRVAELERTVEQHKWYTSRLEVLLRSLENGAVETEQVKEIEEGIKYYVEQNQEVDFVEDDTIFDDLNLDAEEDMFGLPVENDKGSNQDTQSAGDDANDGETTTRTTSASGSKSKSQSTSEPVGRRPSVHGKSPLPVLSALQSSLPSSGGSKPVEHMKPAPLPTNPTGQPLKYASAAAAAAASDKNGVGIAPLPPPPGALKVNATPSPALSSILPICTASPTAGAPPAPSRSPADSSKPSTSAAGDDSRTDARDSLKPSPRPTRAQPSQQPDGRASKAPRPPSPDSGIAGLALSPDDVAPGDEDEEESVFHLPASLSDLLESFEATRERTRGANPPPPDARRLQLARHSMPFPSDSQRPQPARPAHPYNTAAATTHYPNEVLAALDDPRLYQRLDTESLFYAFYYRQGAWAQWLAARALKGQSWRFHKQYQTWFQRHEEPKTITEEFEQGTYRFFDYESTWYGLSLVSGPFALLADMFFAT